MYLKYDLDIHGAALIDLNYREMVGQRGYYEIQSKYGIKQVIKCQIKHQRPQNKTYLMKGHLRFAETSMKCCKAIIYEAFL